MATTAEMVAAKMGDDGSEFTSPDGATLDGVARAHGARVEREPGQGTRYLFADGSSIVDAGGGWDLGYGAECWCWQGAGHSEACLAEKAEG